MTYVPLVRLYYVNINKTRDASDLAGNFDFHVKLWLRTSLSAALPIYLTFVLTRRNHPELFDFIKNHFGPVADFVAIRQA